MQNEKAAYTATIEYVPGQGFRVSVSSHGRREVCPDMFISFSHASRFVEREIERSGFVTEMGKK